MTSRLERIGYLPLLSAGVAAGDILVTSGRCRKTWMPEVLS